MTGNRYSRSGQVGASEPKLGTMFLLSLALHLTIFVGFAGWILPHFGVPRQTVYYVDLVNLPVARPQAGRPESRPAPVKHKPKPKAETSPAPPPAPPKPATRAPLKTVPAKPKARVKAQPAPPPKPATDYRDVEAKIRALQRKKEIEELEARVAELAKNDTRESPVAEAPVGMPEGQGDQAGTEMQAWLKAFFKANWSLSKYQVTSRNPQATVRVVYDARGHLLDYELTKASGDEVFDDSVKRAILRDKQLPFKPGRRIEEDVIFNLKDLMERE